MTASRRSAAAVVFLVALALVPAAQAPAQSVATDGGNPIVGAEGLQIPFVDIQVREPNGEGEVALSLQLLLMLGVLSLAPSIVIIMTSFLRIAIVLDFIRRALSLQQVPPSQVMMGVALFITLFIMWPTFETIYEEAYRPLSDGRIGVDEAFERFEGPMRIFMYRQMRADPDGVALFMRMAGLSRPRTLADVPTYVLIPSFILHELTVAFKIGILLFIPFIIIDMVVASTLMSMGMIMLPPIMISLPFKLILFVLVDGWNLITQQLVASFGVF